jgi:outer membrane translocation and assembly module TamA
LYNTNDLRFISPVHTYLFNGKAGFLVFVDDGRVWMPEEKSDTWHVAYGGGVILAPFNFAYADATYGLSKKEHTIQVRVNFLINP